MSIIKKDISNQSIMPEELLKMYTLTEVAKLDYRLDGTLGISYRMAFVRAKNGEYLKFEVGQIKIKWEYRKKYKYAHPLVSKGLKLLIEKGYFEKATK